MEFEKLSIFLLNNFFLTDWERTWLEARYQLTSADYSVWKELLEKYIHTK